MKVIRLLAVVGLIAACSDRPDVDRTAATPQPEPATPVATAGEDRAPVPPAQPTRRVAEPIEVRDARAAAMGPVTQAATQAGVNPDAAVLQDFKARVDAYLETHKDVAKGTAKLKETKDPAEITKAQDALAAKLQAARKDALPGDVFTPEIRAKFRRLMYPELKGTEGRDAKEQLKEDEPPASLPLKVNTRYPTGASLPTMPTNILTSLPPLPEDLEYRIIGRHLILRDVDANIIVDFIPNAIR